MSARSAKLHLGESTGVDELADKLEKEYKKPVLYRASDPRFRIRRISTRIRVSPEFGYWFSGIFDGEGTLVCTIQLAEDGTWRKYRLGLELGLRADDLSVIQYIHTNLGGKYGLCKKNGRDRYAQWGLFGLTALRNVAVPLFTQYPLRSKKAKEFEIWRSLVEDRYAIFTRPLRGTYQASERNRLRDYHFFRRRMIQIRAIRHAI